jgi:flagellar biosynthesis anti-sigma factor FlgM
MKIEGNNGPQDTKATDQSRRSGGVDGGSKRVGDSRTSGGSDRVELSGDAALRSSALKAANSAPEIRTELVERMRKELAEGRVGNDAHKLADAIIDDLLK